MWSGQVRGIGGGGWHLGIGGRLACRTSPGRLAAAGSFGDGGGVKIGAARGVSGVAGGELGALFKGACPIKGPCSLKEHCPDKGTFCPIGASRGPDPLTSAELGFGMVMATGCLWKGLSTECCRIQMGGVDGGLVGVVMGDFGFGIVVEVPAAGEGLVGGLEGTPVEAG